MDPQIRELREEILSVGLKSKQKDRNELNVRNLHVR